MSRIVGYSSNSCIHVEFDGSCIELNNNQKNDIIDYFHYIMNNALTCLDISRALTSCYQRKINVIRLNSETFKIFCI